eukprot:gene21634-biopygen11682
MSGVGAPAVRPRIRLEATSPLGRVYVWGWGPSYVAPHTGRRLICSAGASSYIH